MRFFQLGLKVAKLLRAMLEATRKECFGIALRNVRCSQDVFVWLVAMVAYARKINKTALDRVVHTSHNEQQKVAIKFSTD